MEVLGGIVLAFAVLALVLEPLVRGRPAQSHAAKSDDDLDFLDVEESDSPKIQALLALREIEFDRATGKLSESDYSELKSTYQRAALEAMEAEEASDTAVESGADMRICPVCGPRPEGDASFCSECGRDLIESNKMRRCGACGGLAPSEAKFCGDCGAAL